MLGVHTLNGGLLRSSMKVGYKNTAEVESSAHWRESLGLNPGHGGLPLRVWASHFNTNAKNKQA